MKMQKVRGLFIGIVGFGLTIVSLFLPFAKNENESKSLVGMAQVYLSSTSSDWNDAAMATFYKIFVPGMVGLMALFVILYLIMNIGFKPVGMIVFNILTIVVYELLKWDFKDRRVVPETGDKGCAFTIMYVAFGIMVVGCIMRFVDKKRTSKTEQTV